MDLRSMTADAILLRYHRLQESLSSPPSLGARLRELPKHKCANDKCRTLRWYMAADGKLRCRRCGRLWPMEMGIAKDSSPVRYDSRDEQLVELAELRAIVTRPPLWPRRVWWIYVVEGPGGYREVASECQRRFPSAPFPWNKNRVFRLVLLARKHVEQYTRYITEGKLMGAEYLTVAELAQRWSVSEKTVRRRIEDGSIEAVNIGRGSRVWYRIPLCSVEEFEQVRKSTGSGHSESGGNP